MNEAIGLGFSGAPTSVIGAIQLQQLQVRIDVVFAGDGVEHEVEGVGVLLHLGGIFGDDDFIRAKTLAVILAMSDDHEHLTTFAIGVQKWSDGTEAR